MRLVERRLAGINLVDALAGLTVAGVGSFAVWEASGYPFGRLNHMGPGYFPFSLGILLIVIGFAILVLEGRRKADEEMPRPALRALLFVCAGLATFGVLIESAGLVPAVAVTVGISALADSENHITGVAVLAVALSVFCVLIFIQALGVPMHAVVW